MTKASAKSPKVRDGWRLPAEPLEQAIGKQIAQHLTSSAFISAIITDCSPAEAED
ncbi:MAG: hypothetical protein JKX93_04575 [Rhizobiaceae bacterium]|nr:hypothetical protein [Rhizobiaceae bacterium]